MGIDHNKLKQRLASRGAAGWKTKPGENRIRVLPPHSRYLTDWEAMDDLSIAYKMHFFRVEGRQTEVSRCLEELKKKCAACGMWRAHRKSDDPALNEMAGNISPADQYLFNILDLNNISAGIEHWAANWTCWQAIMAFAANPQWGNLVDPADGIDFLITMTPGQQSRTGYNQYAAQPAGPTRTTVMELLQAIPEWQAKLDQLEDQIPPPKEEQEIVSLLNEMGFPEKGVVAAAVPAASPVAPTPPPPGNPGGPPATVAPATVAPATVAPATVAPQPVAGGVVPAAQPPAALQPANIQPATPQPVAAATPAAVVPGVGVAAPPAPAEVHYDPGPDYVPKTTNPPLGAPRCFSDYRPEVHQCAPCPALTECQLAHLGVAD